MGLKEEEKKYNVVVVRSPPLLLCCAAAVLLLGCSCGVPVMVSMAAVVVLSRLREDEALSRTLQARYAVVGVFVILCCG